MKITTLFSVLLIVLPITNVQTMQQTKLYKKLEQYCKTLPNEFDQIPTERKKDLESLGLFFAEKRLANQDIILNVICTHNSRRSQMAQLWFRVAASWYGVEKLTAFSGGTEGTAFHPNAVAALKRAGFKIGILKNGDNPLYEANYGDVIPSLMFSKKYDDSTNPKSGFSAIMVCSEADASCPVVPGAEKRFSLPFEDPKYFDGTNAEAEKYDEACRLIARDAFYALHIAKQKVIYQLEKSK